MLILIDLSRKDNSLCCSLVPVKYVEELDFSYHKEVDSSTFGTKYSSTKKPYIANQKLIYINAGADPSTHDLT